MSFSLPFVAAGLVFLGLGCSASNKEQHKPVFPVHGKVLVNGKPAVKAQVIFHPQNNPDPNAIRPSGEVDAEGAFTLSSYTAGDGAPTGEYAVAVLWFEGSSSSGGDAESGGDRLGGRYSNPQRSGLHAKIIEGPNELPPFQLKK